MSDAKDYIEMVLKAAEGFADGAKLDAEKLDEIIEIAERDGVIDSDEIRVLRSIVSRLNPSELDFEMRSKLAELVEKISPA